MKKLWVISLGGSRIAPDKVDYVFLKNFEKFVARHRDKRFVVITGGGSTARRYMSAVKKLGESTKKQSMTGIAVTRMHASYLMRLIGKPANETLPKSMKKVRNLLNKNQIVFAGALRWKDKNTSDGTAADLAAYLKAPFINLTNVTGLYTSNPKTNKKAKLINKISWKKFASLANKIKFSAGQHFILDQNAAKTIAKHKIPTYIVGSLKEMENVVLGMKFNGTLISA